MPRFTSCFECSLDSFPPQKTYPMCTIAETPRLPEHCISYAQLVEWPRAFPTKSVDTDSPARTRRALDTYTRRLPPRERERDTHTQRQATLTFLFCGTDTASLQVDMQWIFEVALKRAEAHDIEGVTYMKTLGVVKNIIPAVASTNAVARSPRFPEASPTQRIRPFPSVLRSRSFVPNSDFSQVAAVCVNEVFKLMTLCSQSLNTYFMYMGSQSVYSHTFCYGKKDDCAVCCGATRTIKISPDTLLGERRPAPL